MQPSAEIPKDPADTTNQQSLPASTLIGIDRFRETAQLVADQEQQPIAICLRPSDAPMASKIPYANRPLAEFNEDPKGMQLIEVIKPAGYVAPANPVATAVTEAVSALPPKQRDALTDHFGLDGKPPAEAAGTADFMAALKQAGKDPDALDSLLSQSAPLDQPDEVAVALRALRSPPTSK